MFIYGYYTTKGGVKEVNQDSLLIIEAETDAGPLLFASVCDGMGGLADGEIASAIAVDELERFARDGLPSLLSSGLTETGFRKAINGVVARSGQRISAYAGRTGKECGTTLLACIFFSGTWYAANVGDTRLYTFKPMRQVTKDQTYVQREMDAGRMTQEEARTHRMRSILLQCIGASDVVVPDWYSGEYAEGDGFMLCSDGFRHICSIDDFKETFGTVSRDPAAITQAIEKIADRSIAQGERDNITAMVIFGGEKHAENRVSNRS